MSTAAIAGNDKAEVLHRSFLKKILCVRKKSHDAIAYCEFGMYSSRQRSIYSFWKRIAEVVLKGDRAVLTAAVKDNMDLAASETTPILQQAWAGTFGAILVRVRVQIELVGDASRFVSEIEGAGREQAASGGARE